MNLASLQDLFPDLLTVKNLFSSATLKMKLYLLRFSTFLKWAAVYLAVAGTFSFSCFLMEESIQLLSFAQFSASDTKQYHLMKRNLDLMEEVNSNLKFINKWFVWMVPPQRLGYGFYTQATDHYIDTLKAEVMANDPSVYAGEQVSLYFTARKVVTAQNGRWVASSPRVKVIFDKAPGKGAMRVEGKLRLDPDVAGGVIISQVE